ncbi:MAG: hypothetical protein AAFR13_05400 [Pseudomonadota bacterium]
MAVVAGACASTTTAWADDRLSTAFQLPGVSLPTGQEEVRAADGTTCRSAIAGSGAYLDIGVIGNPNDIGSSQSAYGRIVIPLSMPRKRLDCTKLYDLELERLRVELELMQMGVGRSIEVPNDSTPETLANSDFNDDEWTTDGLKDPGSNEDAEG